VASTIHEQELSVGEDPLNVETQEFNFAAAGMGGEFLGHRLNSGSLELTATNTRRREKTLRR